MEDQILRAGAAAAVQDEPDRPGPEPRSVAGVVILERDYRCALIAGGRNSPLTVQRLRHFLQVYTVLST